MLSGNGIWLRGEEINTINQDEFFLRKLRVVFSRLSTYADTAESFTHRLLYQIAAKSPDVFVDLAYLPPQADLNLFNASKVPFLLPVSTKLDPCSFDVIGFSNSIIQELVNVSTLLKNSGIPVKKSLRLQSSKVPLVIMGGANAANASLFYVNEPPVDGIFVGESSDAIESILRVCIEAKNANASKIDTLIALESIDGFFQPDKYVSKKYVSVSSVPADYRKVIKKKNMKIEQLEMAPVSYYSEHGNSVLQISEGCPYFCSFCSESWIRKPYVEHRANALLDDAMRLKAFSGAHSTELYSFNFNIHSEFYDVVWKLTGLFNNLGLKSQRFDKLSVDPDILKYLQVLGKSSITCGLEGISSRLRKYLHKNLSDHDLLKGLSALLNSTIRELKIFLIAIGLEEESDYAEFSALLKKINSLKITSNKKLRIVISITPLVRFPYTPLCYADAFPKDRYENVLKSIEDIVISSGMEFRQAADTIEFTVSQILARAENPDVYYAISEAVGTTGFIYYRSFTDAFYREFCKVLQTKKIDMQHLIAPCCAENNSDSVFGFIDTGVTEKFLHKTYQDCFSYNEKEPCFGTRKCSNCGACPDKSHIDFITKSSQRKNYTANELHNKIIVRNKSFEEVKIIVKVGKKAYGLPSTYFSIAVSRAIMLADSSLVSGYAGFSTSFFDSESKGLFTMGKDVLTLRWTSESKMLLVKLFADKNFVTRVNEILTSDWGEIIGISSTAPCDFHLRISSKKPVDIPGFLSQNHLKFIYKKNAQEEKAYYEIVKDSMKKKIVKAVEVNRNDERIVYSFLCGEKFYLYELVRFISKNKGFNLYETFITTDFQHEN